MWTLNFINYLCLESVFNYWGKVWRWIFWDFDALSDLIGVWFEMVGSWSSQASMLVGKCIFSLNLWECFGALSLFYDFIFVRSFLISIRLTSWGSNQNYFGGTFNFGKVLQKLYKILLLLLPHLRQWNIEKNIARYGRFSWNIKR